MTKEEKRKGNLALIIVAFGFMIVGTIEFNDEKASVKCNSATYAYDNQETCKGVYYER